MSPTARIALVVACVGLTSAVAPAALGQESLDESFGKADGGTQSEPAPEASEPAETPETDGVPEAQPDVGLDQLLRLPNSLDFKEERRGGDGAADWRRRFSESLGSIETAQTNLDQAEAALAEAGVSGGSQWQIAPPGQQANSGDTGPLSFKLREDLRRARAALEEAERRHRALVVEADLAEVPADWRVNL